MTFLNISASFKTVKLNASKLRESNDSQLSISNYDITYGQVEIVVFTKHSINIHMNVYNYFQMTKLFAINIIAI